MVSAIAPVAHVALLRTYETAAPLGGGGGGGGGGGAGGGGGRNKKGLRS